jgi:arylsulfatase A-like enzyme
MRDEKIVEMNPDQTTLTHRYLEDAVAFVEANRDRPFFLYFAHMYVHLPLYPPHEFRERSQNGDYGAEVECIDWTTGVLLETLDRLGIAEKTLVIFTSDNGAASWVGRNAPLKGGKGTTWEGGVREPCLMRWPGTIPEGRRCSEIATMMDVLPTLCELSGAEPPTDRVIDGRSVWPLMSGGDDARSPHRAYYYYRGHNLEGVRSGRWKLHFSKVMRQEYKEALYDLEQDVGEERDVAAEHPDVVSRLRGLAEAARDDLGDGVFKGRNCRPAGWVADAQSIPDYMSRA